MQTNDEVIAVACNQLNLDHENQLLCLYQWGSRLFGNETSTSDFDMVAVVDGYVGHLASKSHLSPAEAHYKNVSKGKFNGMQVDIPVYERKYWQSLVDQHIIWILVFGFLRDMRTNRPTIFKESKVFPLSLRLMKLKYEVMCDASKNMKKVKTMWTSEKNYRRSKKRMVYVLQHLQFALQIARTGRIYDIEAGNTYHNEVMPMEFNSWKEAKAWWTPIYNTLFKQLSDACNHYRDFHISFCKKHSSSPSIIDFIDAFGLDTLPYYISVHVLPITFSTNNSDNSNINNNNSASTHHDHKQMYQLLYHSGESPMDVDFVRQCCGTVIAREVGNFRIVALPYTKFFDYNEEDVVLPALDWKHMTIQEKLDGILFTLFYEGTWLALPFHSLTKDFKTPMEGRIAEMVEYFWQVWKSKGYKLPTHTDHCFMFDLVSPKYRHIVRYSEDIVVHGMRNMRTMQEVEIDIDYCNSLGWSVVRSIEPNTVGIRANSSVINNAERLQEFALANFAPLRHCGFVLRDVNFCRITVKSIPFTVLQKMLNKYDRSLETKRHKWMLAMVRTLGEYDKEFLEDYPQYKELFLNVQAKFENYCKQVDQVHASLSHLLDQRLYAEGVKNSSSRAKSALFAMQKQPGLIAQKYFTTPRCLLSTGEKKMLHELVLGIKGNEFV